MFFEIALAVVVSDASRGADSQCGVGECWCVCECGAESPWATKTRCPKVPIRAKQMQDITSHMFETNITDGYYTTTARPRLRRLPVRPSSSNAHICFSTNAIHEVEVAYVVNLEICEKEIEHFEETHQATAGFDFKKDLEIRKT